MRHCVIENRFGPVSFQLGSIAYSGNTFAHSLILFCRQNVTAMREFVSFRPIIVMGRFVLGRSFRPQRRFGQSIGTC